MKRRMSGRKKEGAEEQAQQWCYCSRLNSVHQLERALIEAKARRAAEDRAMLEDIEALRREVGIQPPTARERLRDVARSLYSSLLISVLWLFGRPVLHLRLRLRPNDCLLGLYPKERPWWAVLAHSVRSLKRRRHRQPRHSS